MRCSLRRVLDALSAAGVLISLLDLPPPSVLEPRKCKGQDKKVLKCSGWHFEHNATEIRFSLRLVCWGNRKQGLHFTAHSYSNQ